MLTGDPPPAPGDTRGHGEQLPGEAAVPHPESAHDLAAAAEAAGGGGVKASPAAGESGGGGGGVAGSPTATRRLQRIEGHFASTDAEDNQTDGADKQRGNTQAAAGGGCDIGGGVVGVDGSAGRQCTAAEAAARTARQPKLFLSVGHDEYWSGQQRGTRVASTQQSLTCSEFQHQQRPPPFPPPRL